MREGRGEEGEGKGEKAKKEKLTQEPLGISRMAGRGQSRAAKQRKRRRCFASRASFSARGIHRQPHRCPPLRQRRAVAVAGAHLGGGPRGVCSGPWRGSTGPFSPGSRPVDGRRARGFHGSPGPGDMAPGRWNATGTGAAVAGHRHWAGGQGGQGSRSASEGEVRARKRLHLPPPSVRRARRFRHFSPSLRFFLHCPWAPSNRWPGAASQPACQRP